MARTIRTRSARYDARPPQALPERRGQKRFASYDESRKWLWERLQAGDRDVANALWYWGTRSPKGIGRLPAQLDHLACQSAASWVRSHPARVAFFVTRKALA